MGRTLSDAESVEKLPAENEGLGRISVTTQL
jgi:hypothetical protein